MIDKNTKEFILLAMIVFGNIFLWGTMIISFLVWSFGMDGFRMMIVGIILMASANYMKDYK